METAQIPTETAQPSTFQRIAYSALARAIAGFVACGGTAYVFQLLVRLALHAANVPAEMTGILIYAAAAPAVFVSYILLYRFYERRKVTELSSRGFGSGALAGTAIGAGLQSLVILILYLLGYYTVVSVNGIPALVPGLIIALASGVIEEIIFRGIIFRLTEEKLGSVIALTFTSLLFGLSHIFNPNATLYSAAAIAIEAGIMLGAAYMATRSLWLPIFIHISWNFAEGGVFGAGLSGMHLDSTFITSAISGPPLITGGEFGPENSVIALALCLITGPLLLYSAYQNNLIIAPFWKRRTQG